MLGHQGFQTNFWLAHMLRISAKTGTREINNILNLLSLKDEDIKQDTSHEKPVQKLKTIGYKYLT
jgi:hypothetical protein